MRNSRNIIGYTLVLIIGAVLGATVTAAVDAPKPAYLLASGTLVEGVEEADLMPYLRKAGPAALAAGVQSVASAEVEVLEGSWPHNKTVTIERFASMQALRDFWNSPDYQEAIKLRAGMIKMDFIVAMEGK